MLESAHPHHHIKYSSTLSQLTASERPEWRIFTKYNSTQNKSKTVKLDRCPSSFFVREGAGEEINLMRMDGCWSVCRKCLSEQITPSFASDQQNTKFIFNAWFSIHGTFELRFWTERRTYRNARYSGASVLYEAAKKWCQNNQVELSKKIPGKLQPINKG